MLQIANNEKLFKVIIDGVDDAVTSHITTQESLFVILQRKGVCKLAIPRLPIFVNPIPFDISLIRNHLVAVKWNRRQERVGITCL